MTATCPAGHRSATDDYCDQCGAPIAPPAGPTTATVGAVAGTDLRCDNCGTPHEPGDAFCEVCGLDFATGQLPAAPPLRPAAPAASPRPSAPAPTASAPAPPQPSAPAAGASPPAGATAAATTGWVAVVDADRSFFDTNRAETGAVSFPEGAAGREVALTGDEVLIGRRSERSGHFPDIDCSVPVEDPGVSRRHAVLRRAGDGWEVVDTGSTNGTRVNGRVVDAGAATPVGEDDVVNIGAWTRIVLRRSAGR